MNKTTVGVGVIAIAIGIVIGLFGRGLLRPLKVPPGPKPTAIRANGGVVVFTVQVQGDGNDSHVFKGTINFFSSRILIWKGNDFLGQSTIAPADITKLNDKLIESNASGGAVRELDITSTVPAPTPENGTYHVETVLWWNDGADSIVTEWMTITIPPR
jgi:hypothetical protein